ncbi:MAG: tripartite tricarboxylate transporter substrate binding protein [Betaproteobacteria bacterium]|nr:tripartite tricarboxylate transporter substrate binding protein [Betaproteobacteria bacterium]
MNERTLTAPRVRSAPGIVSAWLRARAAMPLAALFLLLAQGAALAQAWPQRPVRVIVPYSAGGNTDIMARIASERLSGAFGQQFLVENRVGGSGAVAGESVARSAPDGYTFFFCATPQIQIVPLVQKVGYEPFKDFAFVSVVGISPNILAVHPAIPAKTLKEFAQYAGSNPGKLNYGTGGAGTFGHLASVLFASRAGLNMVHVPYKGGAQTTLALVSGEIQMYFGNASELIPQAKLGKVRLLGVSSLKRNAQLPEVPAVAEFYPGFQMVAWNGFLAPAATPKDIVERVSQAVAKAVRDPAVVERLGKLGIDALGNSPAEFAEIIRAETPLFRDAVKASGLRGE